MTLTGSSTAIDTRSIKSFWAIILLTIINGTHLFLLAITRPIRNSCSPPVISRYFYSTHASRPPRFMTRQYMPTSTPPNSTSPNQPIDLIIQKTRQLAGLFFLLPCPHVYICVYTDYYSSSTCGILHFTHHHTRPKPLQKLWNTSTAPHALPALAYLSSTYLLRTTSSYLLLSSFATKTPLHLSGCQQ